MPRYAIGIVVTANTAERAWEEAADRLAPWGNFVGDPRTIEVAPEYDTPMVAAALMGPSAEGAEQ